MSRVVKHLISIIFAIIIVILIQTFIITGAVIQDKSMTPTLKQNDRVIINKIKTTFNMLKLNDIIMYHKGDDVHIGRIIGKNQFECVDRKGWRNKVWTELLHLQN